MNLLYIWNDDYLNIDKYGKTGFLLNSKYDVQYNEQDNSLIIKKNPNYVPSFWGQNIFDVMAIVGDNGSGKTMLLNYLMNIITSIETGEYSHEFFAVFKLEDEKEIKIYVTSKYKNIELPYCLDQYSIVEIGRSNDNSIKKYKVGYFTNALTLNDYQNKRNCIFDASIGGLIRGDFEENYEMHYMDLNDNIILNYYGNQFMRTIKFIFSKEMKKIDTLIRKPKEIRIFLNSYSVNEEYIITELKKMRIGEINNILAKPNFEFGIYFKKMKEYGTLVSKLLISLIINLFKEICIPVTSNDDRTEEALKFLRTLELEYKGFYLDFDMFYTITNFIENINRCVVDNENYKNHQYYNRVCNKYVDFVSWIKENQDYFNNDSVIISNELCAIEVNEKNEKFMLELLQHYEKTSFAFPYLKFNFGLSAGEFNFLNLFANIYSILEIGDMGEASVIKNTYIGSIKCTDLLLIFDEADLSLHPRWQQQYLYWLLKFIESVFPMCRVHILIATHSPIMLSDFPQDNVIYLHYKEEISI